MTDRYARIREALAMGPTPGPFSASRSYSPGNQELILRLTRNDEYGITENYCTVRNSLGDTWKTEADAAFIAACDPDTIRALLAERDRLATTLQAEVEALRAEVDGTIRELIAERNTAREDAERWRALRELDGGEIYALLGDCDGVHPEQADAAIDRARGKGGKEASND